jgi:hypothetical protein
MASDAEELACLSRVLLSRCRAHPALGLLRPEAKTRKRGGAIRGPMPQIIALSHTRGSLGRSGINPSLFDSSPCGSKACHRLTERSRPRPWPHGWALLSHR